jgi:chitinase
MKEIKKQLDEVNEDFILSAAVPGGPWNAPRYEIANLTPVLDYFNLMTYDFDDATIPTHLTALYASSHTTDPLCSVDGTVNYYLLKGGEAIRNKLVVGAAFYVRQFHESEGIGQVGSKKTSISYSSFKKDYIDKEIYEEQWDDVAKAPYLVDEANNFVFTYDNPRSIIEKSNYVIDNGLAGMMFWQYAQDSSGTLLDAIYQGLKLN